MTQASGMQPGGHMNASAATVRRTAPNQQGQMPERGGGNGAAAR